MTKTFKSKETLSGLLFGFFCPYVNVQVETQQVIFAANIPTSF